MSFIHERMEGLAPSCVAIAFLSVQQHLIASWTKIPSQIRDAGRPAFVRVRKITRVPDQFCITAARALHKCDLK